MTEQVYASAYPIYRDLGWRGSIKLGAATKWPPPTGFTGHNGVDPSGADMHAWAEAEPDGNIAIRLPADIIGIDVDCYGGKTGAAALAEAEKRWGKLPYSPRSSSRPNDPISGIRFYRIPEGVELADVIEFPDLGIGDIEVIQRHHRYAVCWPSIHPEGRRYQWWGIDGGPLGGPPAPADVPDLPRTWIEGLPPKRRNGCNLGDTAPYDVKLALTDGAPSQKVAWRLGEALAALYGGAR